MKPLAFATAATLLAAPIAAQPFTPYEEVEGWSIFVNEATNGCFMEERQDARILQMGTQGGADFGFVAIYREEDIGIAQGEEIEVLIDIDGEEFVGVAQGVRRELADGGVIDGAFSISRSPEFGGALANGQTMTMLVDGTSIVEVDLTGTKAAMEATLACQQSLGG